MKNVKSAKDLAQEFSKSIEKSTNQKKSKKAFLLYEKWQKIIGDEKLAQKCELFDIKNDTMILKTSHTGWSQQIIMRKKSILRNINKIYPELEVKSISIFIDEKLENERNTNFKGKKQNLVEKKDLDLYEEYNIEDKNIEKKEMNPELEKALKALKKSIIRKSKK